MTSTNTYSDIAKIFNLPTKAISELYKDGIIKQMPPDIDEMRSLWVLSKTWGKDRFIKMQLTRHSKAKRKKLADTCELNKSESYALSRFKQHRTENGFTDARRLTVNDVVGELNTYYKIPITRELHAMVRRMRWRVYKIKPENL